MTQDQERWAEALAIERQHGENAPRFIAERIGALALAGDMEGVERWKEIAEARPTLWRQTSMKRPIALYIEATAIMILVAAGFASAIRSLL